MVSPSPDLLATLARATLGVPSGEVAPADLARTVRDMLAHQPELERRQLAMALRGLDLAPRLLGWGARLTELPDDRATAFVRGMAQSPLAPVRRLAGALRTLLGFATYGRPEAWGALGYDGPWVGRLDVEHLPDPAIEPLLDDPFETGADRLRVQACVIGSGAAGAVAAARLAEAGVDTLLVEEGDHHATGTMTQDEHTMIPRLFQEGGQRTTSDQGILVMQGRALGGSSTHNTGLSVPVREALWESWFRRGAAPCSYEAFRPYLDGVMTAIGARVADEDEINRNNQILRAGAEELGHGYFVSHHNRIRCSGCGYCTLGCAYNRKGSVVHAFLPSGAAAGLRLARSTRADRLERAGDRWRVRAIRHGRPVTIEADRVVLSGGAVGTPLLLQRSGLARGLRCGRDLRLHPFAPIGADFEDEILAWRGVPQSVLLDGALDPGEGGGYVLMVAAAQPASTASLTPAYGQLHRELMGRYRHLAAAGVLVHDRARGTVTQRADGKPILRYWPDPRDVADLRAGIRELARLYFSQGARRVILPFVGHTVLESPAELDRIEEAPFRPHSVVLASAHPQGTCPMGPSPKVATTTAGAEVHGCPGLHVADTSLFPSSLGVPPQVTTMALGGWVGEDVARRLGTQKQSQARGGGMGD